MSDIHDPAWRYEHLYATHPPPDASDAQQFKTMLIFDAMAREALDRRVEGGLNGAIYRGMLKRSRQRYAAEMDRLLFGDRTKGNNR